MLNSLFQENDLRLSYIKPCARGKIYISLDNQLIVERIHASNVTPFFVWRTVKYRTSHLFFLPLVTCIFSVYT